MFHGTRLRRYDVNLQAARAQRGSHFQPNETSADHQAATHRSGMRDDRVAVGQGAQHMHMRQGAAGDIEPDRLGAGGEQQRSVIQEGSIGQHDSVRLRLYRCNPYTKLQSNMMLSVKLRRP